MLAPEETSLGVGKEVLELFNQIYLDTFHYPRVIGSAGCS